MPAPILAVQTHDGKVAVLVKKHPRPRPGQSWGRYLMETVLGLPYDKDRLFFGHTKTRDPVLVCKVYSIPGNKNFRKIRYVPWGVGALLAVMAARHIYPRRSPNTGKGVKEETRSDPLHNTAPQNTRQETPRVSEVILYTAGSFNPIHTGHLQMVKLALDHCQREGYIVTKILFGPANNSHLSNKVNKKNTVIRDHNQQSEELKLPQTQFSDGERLAMVAEAIAKFDWQGVPCETCNLELRGGDHYDAVHAIQYKNPGQTVILVAGEDLMNDMVEVWNKHNISAIVIRRSAPNVEVQHSFINPPNGVIRHIISNDEATKDVSSTAIATEK